MRRVIAVLMLLCASCVDRTENLDFSTNASVELEIPEMVPTDGGIGGIEGQKTVENGRMPKEKYNNGTSEATGKDENATYSSENEAKTASNHTDRESISEAVFYIFDENGLFMSKNIFAGGDDYKLNFTKNGRHSVYVLCNISEFVDLPASPSQDELESLTVPHCESYDRLPFAGKTEVNVTPGEKPAIKIKLDRINSAIRIENRSADKIALNKVTVNGLPNRGNIFGIDTEAAGVTYSESAEAEIDADGNAVVYSFFVPESKIANVKIEAEARVKDTEETGTTAATIAPLTFIDRLETGKQATALVGYLESGNLKIGSPDNWGNVGKYELPGGVRLQVVGGEFFDYKSAKALRAYSGGSEFSFVVEAADGVATLQTVGPVDWVTIKNNTIIVAANDTPDARECQVSVSVDGSYKGVFYIVQGKMITFSCSNIAIVDNRVEMVGGSGSSFAITVVSFDIDDEEFESMEITPKNNGINGITVDVDRETKRLKCHFMPIVDLSLVETETSVPVEFVDTYGISHARIDFVQRPAKITITPGRVSIPDEGGTVTATVTVEGDANWNVRSITDSSGGAVSWLPKPAGNFKSGGNLSLTVAANVGNIRTAYIRVQSRYTISEPYEITQIPSYGIRNISSDINWDAATSTLKAYSKGRDYTLTFDTATAIPDDMELSVDCNHPGITASPIISAPDGSHTFTLTVADSDNTEKEVAADITVTADGNAIGEFTVLMAYKPSFTDYTDEVWGGVKNRPWLKRAIYRASEWDIKDFTSSNEDMPVTKISASEIEVAYAETLMYDDTTRTAVITMNLNGGNSITYDTEQSPVYIMIEDLSLWDGAMTGGEADLTVVTRTDGKSSSPWRVASVSSNWFRTVPNVGDTETNASGGKLIVKVDANAGGKRLGYFTVESWNTTSQKFQIGQRDPLSTVTIGGVQWMQYNLANPRQAPGGATFATALPSECTGMRLASHGKLYQWGYNVAWSTIGALKSIPDGNIWQPAPPNITAWTDSPCPEGFRLPTAKEFQNLINACTVTFSGGWSNNDCGYIVLTNKADNTKKLEFLATGDIFNDKTRYSLGKEGFYWASVYNPVDKSKADFMYITDKNVKELLYDKLSAFNLRCVRQ